MAPYERFATAYDNEANRSLKKLAALRLASLLGAKEQGSAETLSILELGCGTGLFTECLLDAGFRVTGIDCSRSMLEHASRRIGSRSEVNLVLAEMPKLDVPNLRQHDAVCSLSYPVGYLIADSAVYELMKRVSELLKPGGFVVLDSLSAHSVRTHYVSESLARSGQRLEWFDRNTGVYLLSYSWEDPDVTEYHMCRAHSHALLTDAADAAGLLLVEHGPQADIYRGCDRTGVIEYVWRNL